jgi:prolyl oligopeptidase
VTRTPTLPGFPSLEPVTDILHGVPISDPYRWLEDQDSTETRLWLQWQSNNFRSYLSSKPWRSNITKRVKQLLAITAYDSVQQVTGRYFFRKRLPDQQQACICMREGIRGSDLLLVDPAKRGKGSMISVAILQISASGRYVAYEVRNGGTRAHSTEILCTVTMQKLADRIPYGILRGFYFSPNDRGFYYVLEEPNGPSGNNRVALWHEFGSDLSEDQEVFRTEAGGNERLSIVCNRSGLYMILQSGVDRIETKLYFIDLSHNTCRSLPHRWQGTTLFLPFGDNLFVVTEHGAPNRKLVKLDHTAGPSTEFRVVVPEVDAMIVDAAIVGERVFVGYVRNFSSAIASFDLDGNKLEEVPLPPMCTARFRHNPFANRELIYECETFSEAPATFRYLADRGSNVPWSSDTTARPNNRCEVKQVWYSSSDQTRIHMFLVGHPQSLSPSCGPAVLTAYGGFGTSMTPRYSIFVSYLMEQGCLFALPNIRGGCELGRSWHNAGQRRNRERAFEDFLSAAEWLTANKYSCPSKLGVFGGSNSGLLVGVALTKRPDLFAAMVCIHPLLDMLRYELFDRCKKFIWEYGTVTDKDDFEILRSYSPYHAVHKGMAFPAVLLVSGRKDSTCNPMHVTKMTAHLQAANASSRPILLDYKNYRGHRAVMPISEKTRALTDRLTFMTDQLGIQVAG